MSRSEGSDRNFMGKLKKRPKKRKYAVLDLETKRRDSQDKGFERCFLACFYDGENYDVFRNDTVHKGKSYKTCFWLEQDGAIDKMMRHIFGLQACGVCEVSATDHKFGSCGECIKARRRYQADEWLIGSHNGGNFDNLFILGWLRRHADLFGFEIISTMGRILTLTVKPRGKIEGRERREAWTFVDTYALLPITLKEVGASFCAGEEAFQKMVFDLDLPEDDESWGDYNLQDCIVLHTALSRFSAMIEKLGGNVAVTAAGTAMNVFRFRYQKKLIHRNAHFPFCDGRCRRVACDIKECQDTAFEERQCHGCMHDFVREGFFGGRTEVFRLFGKNVFYYDINSSYPTAMLGDMPVGDATVLRDGASLHMLKSMAVSKIGFVECIIDIPVDTYLPVLPYRWVNPDTHDTKLIFPVGTLYGVWDWLEIEAALEAGAKIRAVGRSVWYKKAKIFDKMIKTMYAYRNKICTVCRKNVKEGECKCATKTWDEGLDYCAKLMMNSTFGKFGTNPIREQMLFPTTEDDIPPHAEFPSMEMFEAGAPIRFQKVLENDFIIPQIAAHITAEARVRVYKGLKSVLDRGGWIIYTDTDACMGTLPVWPEGPELGQWKLEEKHFDVEVPLPKTYMISRHEGGCEGRDPNCKGCARMHKKSCDDHENCLGCAPIHSVKMKGVPKGVQRPDVFEHLTKWGTGVRTCGGRDHCRKGRGKSLVDECGAWFQWKSKKRVQPQRRVAPIETDESCPCGSGESFKQCHFKKQKSVTATKPSYIDALKLLKCKRTKKTTSTTFCDPQPIQNATWSSSIEHGDIRIDERTKKIVQVIMPEDDQAAKGVIHFDRLTKFRTMFKPVKGSDGEPDQPLGIYSPVERPTSKSIRSTYDKRRVCDAPPGHPDFGNTYPHVIFDPFTLKEARAKRSNIVLVELADAAE